MHTDTPTANMPHNMGVEVAVDFQKAELFLNALFTDPKLLGSESAGQALLTCALGIILLYSGMMGRDLEPDPLVKVTEQLLQNAAMLLLPASESVQ